MKYTLNDVKNITNRIKTNETIEGNEKLFKNTIKNVRIVGKKKFACIDLSLIFVHLDYQRLFTRDMRRILRLIEKWNDNQMDALKVVEWPEINAFSLVDGLGRLYALTLMGAEDVECEIISAPEDQEERLKFEINIFLNQTAEKVTSCQMHKGKLYLGEAIPTAIDNVTKRHNVILEESRGQSTGNVVRCYHRLEEIVKRSGEEGLDWVFDVIKIAGYNLENNGYRKETLRSLGKIYDGYNGNIDKYLIGNYMKQRSYKDLLGDAREKYPRRSDYIAITLLLQDYISDTTKFSTVFDSNGKKIAA